MWNKMSNQITEQNTKQNNLFLNRVYGCAIIKSINSNYNADFTHQPRTLPDGIAYATDKALKYIIKHYLVKNYSNEKFFFWKRLKENMIPCSLEETYTHLFGDFKNKKVDKNINNNKDNESLQTSEETNRNKVLSNLLQCLDVRLFGATYAGKDNISIHGPVQISHGMNRYPKNEIYSEQIMSPFRNPGEKGSDQKKMTTIGSQSKLREGHYVHHFSINPKNLESLYNLLPNDENIQAQNLTVNDIEKLKEALQSGATLYDSASKAGTENELLLWIELNENEKLVLPNFTEMIKVTKNKDGYKIEIDFSDVANVLEKVQERISKIEIYYNQQNTEIIGLDELNKMKLTQFDLYSAKEVSNTTQQQPGK